MRPNLKLEIRQISPSLARELLKRNLGNRPIAPGTVTRYASLIRRGNWVLAEPLLFDEDGNLLDGQHRLLAVIEADRSAYFVVISGYDRELVFLHLGKGKVRSFADDLALKHVENAQVVAAAMRHFYLLYHGRFTGGVGGKKSPSPDELWDLLQTMGADTMASSIKGTPPRISKICNRALMVALHMMFSAKDRTLADAFMDDLASGARLSLQDPIYRLRERLLEAKSDRKRKIILPEVAALTIKAWNLVRKGEKIPSGSPVLRWRSIGPQKEPFPKVQ